MINNKSLGEHINKTIMKTGTVKFFNEVRGFGFITVDGTGEEVFVHKSDVQGTIRESDAVEFELQNGKKGLNAVDVRAIR
jgi:cold shock protein